MTIPISKESISTLKVKKKKALAISGASYAKVLVITQNLEILRETLFLDDNTFLNFFLLVINKTKKHEKHPYV